MKVNMVSRQQKLKRNLEKPFKKFSHRRSKLTTPKDLLKDLGQNQIWAFRGAN